LPAHVLYGDSFLVPQELKRLEAQEGASGLLEANRHRLRGDQARLPELVAICQALPFMDARRLVVVEGLLTTMERRPGRGRMRDRNPRQAASPPGPLSIEDGEGAAKPGVKPPGGWEALARVAPAMPETTLLVLVDGPLSENNSLLRSLRPVARVQELKTPTGETLARWIKTAAQQKGSSISPAAIGCLSQLVGNDLWTLDREIEKLSLYAAGRTIGEADVRELVSQVREASIFVAVDAMLEGKAGIALRLVRQLRQDGREVSSIMAMIERQLRLLALARDLTEGEAPPGELGHRLGTPSQFVLNKTLEQARRHSWKDITWCYHRLLEADLSLKQGRLEPDLALEVLVGDLASRAR
jgi:DNA polymerase-3 subunit delta